MHNKLQWSTGSLRCTINSNGLQAVLDAQGGDDMMKAVTIRLNNYFDCVNDDEVIQVFPSGCLGRTDSLNRNDN